MALTITSVGNATSITSTTTLASGATVTANVGDVLLICIAADNPVAGGGARTITIADNAAGSTNVYTQRGSTGIATSGTALDGAAQYFFECPVTTALSGNVVTLTFNNAITLKAMEIYRLEPSSGKSVVFQAVGTAVNSTPDTGLTSHTANTVSVTNGHTIFGMAAIETDDTITGDSDTTDGSWSAVSTRLADNGADPSTISCVTQYKTVSATGNQTWTATTVTARDSSSNYIIYSESGPASYSLTVNTSAVTLTGSSVKLTVSHKLSVDTSAVQLTGSSVALKRGFPGLVSSASVTLSGSSVAMKVARVLAVSTRAISLTGASVLMTKGGILSVGSGTITLVGSDVTMKVARILGVTGAEIVLAGSSVYMVHEYPVAANSNEIVCTGGVVDLIKIGSESGRKRTGARSVGGAPGSTRIASQASGIRRR